METQKPGSERVSELLAVACRVIARRGVHGVRMGEVAREAGVSNALLHYYFVTRSALLVQAFAYAEERAHARARHELEGLPDGVARLERLLRLYVGDEPVFQENWVLWNEMWSSALFDDAVRPAVQEAYGRWLGWIIELVRAGQRDGSIDASLDAEETGRRLGALVDGLGSQLLLGLITQREVGDSIGRGIRLELDVAPKGRAR